MCLGQYILTTQDNWCEPSTNMFLKKYLLKESINKYTAFANISNIVNVKLLTHLWYSYKWHYIYIFLIHAGTVTQQI